MERLTTLVHNSNIFDYFKIEHNVHKELQSAIYTIVKNRLYVDLSSKQKKILSFRHSHQPDPNAYNEATHPALLKRLIDDACFQGMGFGVIKTKLYMHDLKKFTGLESMTYFENQIAAINEVWQKQHIATISYKEKHISFEILLKK